MKNKSITKTMLVTATLLMSSGCIIEGDNTLNSQGGVFNINWDLIGGCPPGATGARFYYQLDGETGAPYSDEAIGCESQGMYTSNPLPLGNYSAIWFNIIAPGLNGEDAVLAQSDAVPGVLSFEGDVIDLPLLDVPTTAGYMEFNWSISNNVGGALTCADVGATNVFLSATLDDGDGDPNNDQIFDFTFPCNQTGLATTDLLPIGTYQTDLLLVDPGNNQIGPSLSKNGLIEFGNHYNDLGTFDFVPAP